MTTILSFRYLARQCVVSLRLLLVTVVLCSGCYTALILFAAQVIPDAATGSLLHSENGQVIGSTLLAQQFTHPEYFWPRPSAVSWNASGSGGSNISPASLAMRQRTEKLLAALAPKKGEKVPTDLITASGSGLDPHISLEAAIFQVPRVARARGISRDQVMRVINNPASGTTTIPLLNESLVNVLQLNRSLDRMQQ